MLYDKDIGKKIIKNGNQIMKIKKNLDVLLYEKIKDGFLKCEYKLGEKIDIDQLAEKYEVSRTPIIQAIKRLENEGMMETGRGGKGAGH